MMKKSVTMKPTAEQVVKASRCQVADALVVAMVVVFDEGGGFNFPLKEVGFEQDAVLKALAPARDFALDLGPFDDCLSSPAR